jgi:hypothetical protein
VALILWVAMAASPAPGAAGVAQVDFDLAKVQAADAETRITGCRGGPAGGDGTEIVVCARRRGGDYPMAEMERRYGERPLLAETGIAGGAATARAYVEQVELAPGQVAKRAMIGIKLPF